MYLGKGFIIRSGASIGGSHFKCGNNVRVGHGCHFFGHIEIGNDVMIAPNVIIASDYHGMKKNGIPMIFQKGPSKGKVIIGNDIWIAANSVILKEVNIGDGAVIGAGSVVTKSVPSFAVIAGNPAKIVKFRK